ncbi:MAG: bifunctional proline dehydrogenase/L-glutamate gamma-semialdehyde dehydrogenase [Bifidobacteriaceae bacterium]|jgi:RHH-type proline utilization regulon transcriptional repressor/proline dehydrogenase/delta 1-pyrroline-5-carboxylate dehydrogenase|nr:bifunctional proline dehydrogenase/L-glutamate gamma-semialdehyde dehydrogenase [Bifidobacteriaceae bacterium]
MAKDASTAAKPPAVAVTPDSLVEPAIELARRWSGATDTRASAKEVASNKMLARMVQDQAGLDFTMAFVDRVARPEDTQVAARELRKLATSGNIPDFISKPDRFLVAVGGRMAPLLPGLAMPLARARLRQMVGHLVVDAADRPLSRHIERARAAGYRLNLNLLGEAVLGEKEARKRLDRTIALVRRPDVDYVSIKISSLASQLVTWDRAGSVARILEHLRPLLQAAGAAGTFVNLDMEEYRDLDLTLDAFRQALLDPEFLQLEAGIVIQCYLPDALGAIEQLVAFAQERQAAGGAAIKVRLVKGANLSMEQVECSLHGWEQAIYPSKEAVDANYVRVLAWVLRPERLQNLRVGVAGHNLFHLALAHLLAQGRGVSEAVEFEMLQGMAPAQADAVKDTTGGVLFYTPVVAAEDFDVAISYLVRRLEENAAPQNFLHQSFAPVADPLALAEAGFRQSVLDREKYSLSPRRGQVTPPPAEGFYNQPDSDAAVQSQRDWALAALAATPPELVLPVFTEVSQVDEAVHRAAELSGSWATTPVGERARALRAAADALNAHRGDLLTIMAHEGGKTVAEADPEISEAVDFARYYALSAEQTLQQPGLVFKPSKVTVVIPPWNFPVAIPVGGIMAALAAGSAVLVKPATATRRCVEVAAAAIQEGLRAAGADPDLLQVVHVAGRELGQRLVTHPEVETVVLTGSIETAALFAGWRPELNLLAETSGKNAIITTPSADLDLAVADLVKSAFGHAGQKCSAASLGILVGSVYRSRRFLGQLADSVRSLSVGPGWEVSTTMGPVIEVPSEKLRRGLTQLDPGEKWLVQPRQLDDSGRLWSPGLKVGVTPGSWFHLTECFGPVLGLMEARDLDHAIELQNATAFGLTGGIHSLDAAEVEQWLDQVEVGNAYVNRHITGAIVQRQPFGGWKASAIGPGAKAGGPNYVAEFGVWTETEPPADWDAWLEQAKLSDQTAWAEEFGREHDPSGLRVEANVFRYRPVPRYTVRVGESANEHQVQRVLAAAARAGVPTVVSRWGEETHEAFAHRVQESELGGRIRVVGRAPGLREAAATRLGEVTILDQPVTGSGRRELLNVLHEQALSITKHRFGHVSD